MAPRAALVCETVAARAVLVRETVAPRQDHLVDA